MAWILHCSTARLYPHDSLPIQPVVVSLPHLSCQQFLQPSKQQYGSLQVMCTAATHQSSAPLAISVSGFPSPEIFKNLSIDQSMGPSASPLISQLVHQFCLLQAPSFTPQSLQTFSFHSHILPPSSCFFYSWWPCCLKGALGVAHTHCNLRPRY